MADKKSSGSQRDDMADSLPIKGKNRLEDEVILLNKREAWRRENEKQLEEVAFGKDMRSNTSKKHELLEKFMKTEKPSDNTSSRTKREELGTNRRDNPRAPASAIDDVAEKSKGSSAGKGVKGDNGIAKENDLRSLERGINVFADNKSEGADAGEQAGGKLTAINARPDNPVRGKLGAINCETKIDNATDGGGVAASPVNSTLGRREVPEVRGEANDNAVKLNQPANRPSERTGLEVELEDLRREEGGERIRGVVEHEDSTRDDNRAGRNKLRSRYTARAGLDKPGDPDTDPGSNLEFLRLEGDVVGWRVTPIIRGVADYDVLSMGMAALKGCVESVTWKMSILGIFS